MQPSRPSLLIIGHGSSVSKTAEEAAIEHAKTLSLSHRFGTIQTYFLKAGSDLPELPEGEIFLLPFFMSDGFFVKQRIPSVFSLKDGQRIEADRQLYMCDAFGVDPELAMILKSMALERLRNLKLEPSETAVLLIAHGSGKSSASEEAARLQQSALANISAFGAVDVAFLEQNPTIADGLDRLAGRFATIICLGLFAGGGPHANQDVPTEIADWQKSDTGSKAGVAVFYEGAVGERAEVVRLIQDSISRRAASLVDKN
ncbi:CbiX/SirB N-terminal domain-containing protein [Sneathiella limimaris]|uniref:CbiX/SirB N-terminal domain-containing protein n=1 Tax=Sneathiella limimaris TaxID=1964213 RepID=UPI00146C39C7|nr:CbiX/SirB N-terminal domain-containing protein [Sneathiella limimaris]